MPDQKPTLDYRAGPIQVLTGSASRAFLSVGGVCAAGTAVVAAALWAFAREPISTKVIVTLAMFGVGLVATSAASVAARFTIVRIQSGMLNFSFCGVRTCNLPLDSTTTFHIRRIGRMRVLVITAGQKTYVPAGGVDQQALIELLRLNCVVETP